MIRIDRQRAAADLLPAINRLFDLSAQKIRSIEDSWRPENGSPVFTVDGVYRSRGWTEWTQGFQFGAPLLQFDATCDREFLELGRSHTLERMAPHLTHVGVHDHGFNNVSTYGNLWRLAHEGQFEAEAWELRFYALALKVTGAVQARRWTSIPGGGFIYSFNGAHSLVRRHDPHAARAGAFARAWPSAVRRAGRAGESARAAAAARARNRRVQRVLRQRPRHVRRARPNGAREPVQCGQRNVSRSQLAARLLAVLDVDARPRVGDARVSPSSWSFCRRSIPRSWLDFHRNWNRNCRNRNRNRAVVRGGGGDVRLLHRSRRGGRRRSVLGYRRARTRCAGRLGGSRCRSVQRS